MELISSCRSADKCVIDYYSSIGKDVIFYCEDGQVECHKIILCLASPLMLDIARDMDTVNIILPETNRVTVEDLFGVIVTGDVPTSEVARSEVNSIADTLCIRTQCEDSTEDQYNTMSKEQLSTEVKERNIKVKKAKGVVKETYINILRTDDARRKVPVKQPKTYVAKCGKVFLYQRSHDKHSWYCQTGCNVQQSSLMSAVQSGHLPPRRSSDGRGGSGGGGGGPGHCSSHCCSVQTVWSDHRQCLHSLRCGIIGPFDC